MKINVLYKPEELRSNLHSDFSPFVALGTGWMTGIQFPSGLRTFIFTAVRVPVPVSVQHGIK